MLFIVTVGECTVKRCVMEKANLMARGCCKGQDWSGVSGENANQRGRDGHPKILNKIRTTHHNNSQRYYNSRIYNNKSAKNMHKTYRIDME